MHPIRPDAAAIVIALAIGLSACGDSSDVTSVGVTTIGVTTAGTSVPEPAPPVSDSPTTPSPDAAPSPSPSTSTALPASTTEPLMPPIPAPSGPTGSPTEIAIADLAVRLGVDPSTIEVVTIDEVTWPDGALGCPAPGRLYTQALVDGSRLVLRTGGTTHEYHSGRGRDPFYCPPAQIQAPVGGRDPST